MQKGIQNGKRLLVVASNSFVTQEDTTELNSLLLAFDMGITTDKIFMRNNPTRDERLLLLRSKDQTYAWDSPLLKDVEDIVVQQPQLLWYGKDAGPFLVCPTGAELVDSWDLLKIGPRELACAGIWPVQRENRVRVLVLAGGILHNPYQGITGQSFPGITRNQTFARNLINWLANAGPQPSASISNVAVTLHAIEVGLHDVITAILQKEFGKDSWTKGVPKKIRKDAVQLREEEDRAAPEEAYLYLLDRKEIIEKQWRLFAPFFEESGKGRSKSLEWFARLNEIRNRNAHPIKLRHRPLDAEEVQFLKDRLRFVQNVAQKCGVTVNVPA